jgi:hypothetical protein
MKMRIYQGKPPATVASGPTTPNGWDTLMSRVIARATELGHRGLAGFARAQSEGRSEKYLRAMGILSETDIDRELPQRKT